jgi:tetratricopeptide (TPR) repeat protein
MYEKIDLSEATHEEDIAIRLSALRIQLAHLDNMEKSLDDLKNKVTDAIIQKVGEESQIFHNHMEEYKIQITTLQSITKEQTKFGGMQYSNMRKPSVSSFTGTTALAPPAPEKKTSKTPTKSSGKPKEENKEIVSPRRTQSVHLNDELSFMNDHKVPFGRNIVLENMKRKFKDTSEARSEIEEVLRQNLNIKSSRFDGKVSYLFKKAVFYKVDKNYDYAMKTFNHILDICPNHLLSLIQKAQTYEKQKKTTEMNMIIQEVLKAPIFDLDDYFVHGEAKFMHEMTKTEGLNMIKAAASKGNHHAQLRLGSIYFAGDSIKIDRKKGLQYFLLSANQGNAQAQYNYGYSMVTGDFCPKNEQEGVKFLKMSADQGYSNAEFRMGKYYESKNRGEALKWYERAAAKNHDGACTALDFLEVNTIPYTKPDIYGKVVIQK